MDFFLIDDLFLICDSMRVTTRLYYNRVWPFGIDYCLAIWEKPCYLEKILRYLVKIMIITKWPR